MRDQPFKRYFTNERSVPRDYKYPTYQHYYENKNSNSNEFISAKNMQISAQTPTKTEINQLISPTPALSNKKSVKSNLKTELQNLKNQVHKIMQKKQGILRSPIQRKLFGGQRTKIQSQTSFQIQSLNNGQQISDQQSVTSERLLIEPLKKLELKKTSENYDHSQYMELENNLLKTELRNLKNKYINKKRQLNQKCQAQEKKIVFLQTSLYKSEQTLALEITNLKEALKQSRNEAIQDVPTSDKISSKTISPLKRQSSSEQSEKVKEKLKSLYDQLSQKNKYLYQKQQKIQNQAQQISKYRKQISNQQQKLKKLSKDLQFYQSDNDKLSSKLEQSDQKIMQLEANIQQKEKDASKYNDSVIIQLENSIKSLKNEYENKVHNLEKKIQSLQSNNERLLQEKMIVQEEMNYLKQESEDKSHNIEQLNIKIREQVNKNIQTEEKYQRIIDIAENKHEELIRNIRNQYQNRITSITPKKQKQNEKTYSTKSPIHATHDENLQKELKKWKIEYKLLKQRHQSYMTNENTNKSQLKQYYRTYRQSKQKIQILTHKNQLLQKEFDKYKKILTTKDNQLIQKQVELRKISNNLANLQSKYSRQTIFLYDKVKNLEEKYCEQQQKNQKEIKFRKDIQQKISETPITDESIKEINDRLKKRMIEQDEKLSKNVKQLKNKETIISKLKQQLRQLMENLQKRVSEQKNAQIKQLIANHLTKENESFAIHKEKTQQQKKILMQSQERLIEEIEKFKLQNNKKSMRILQIENELKMISHSYNTKIIQTSQALSQKQHEAYWLRQKIEQTQTIKMRIENLFREEINSKSEQISLLRSQLLTKCFALPPIPFNASFDEILKNQIEGNNKLRQQSIKRAEQIYKARDNYSTLKSQYDNLKSESDINKLKFISEKKNLEVAFQVEIQNYKNQIDGWDKKVNSLEQKIKIIIEENKKKDSFIQSFIMGKKLSQNDKEVVADFIKQYEIVMGSRDITDRLMNQYKEIEKLVKYNEALLKEISQLKEKFLLYEVIDQEKLSLYESKVSRHMQRSAEGEIEDESSIGDESHESKLKKTFSMQNFVDIEKQY